MGRWEHAWRQTRELVTFTLGVVVMLDALDVTGSGRNIGEMIVALVMIGILPLDRLLALIDRRTSRRTTALVRRGRDQGSG